MQQDDFRKTNLNTERARLVKDVNRFRDQVEEAKEQRRTKGISADPTWWDDTNRKIYEGRRRIAEIDKELNGLRTQVDTNVYYRKRAAILFKIAKAADAYLYADNSDVDDEVLGDALEDALKDLEELAPNWRNHTDA
jgi:hypothetical protein